MKIAIRPNYTYFDEEKFQFCIEHILNTTYKSGAKSEEAPNNTDCITAVRWILGQSSDFLLPRGYIGDFPKMLEANSQKIPISDIRVGDLVFFERMSFTHKKYMISHIGIMVSGSNFFHSSLHFGGGKISSLADFDYKNSILDESFLAIARDPRHYD
ncbi:C40 family peptidase [Candidatus Gracilibacteria bacterium]|nr:C40 family peptidase [Candidatus Gracilibacteria bacterium]